MANRKTLTTGGADGKAMTSSTGNVACMENFKKEIGSIGYVYGDYDLIYRKEIEGTTEVDRLRFRQRHTDASNHDPTIAPMGVSLTTGGVVAIHKQVDEEFIYNKPRADASTRKRLHDLEVRRFCTLVRERYNDNIKNRVREEALNIAGMITRVDEPLQLLKEFNSLIVAQLNIDARMMNWAYSEDVGMPKDNQHIIASELGRKRDADVRSGEETARKHHKDGE